MIKSELNSLESISNQEGPTWYFNIPRYQRLYVWGPDQIETLLTDIANAYDRGEEQFFLGGALLVEQTTETDKQNNRRSFDLIDGQQRFTTLWLLGTVAPWGGKLRRFSAMQGERGLEPRLHFSIREHVNDYLKNLLDKPEVITGELADTDSLRKAQKLMQSFPDNYKRADGKLVDDTYIKEMANFIYSNVKLALTQVPKGMDLNKLFEVINNRGVQLQHHEILKSQLLHEIPTEKRGRYGALWDACADMDSFIERSLCSVTQLQANQLGRLYKEGQLASPDAIHKLLLASEKSGAAEDRMSLDVILKPPAQDDGQGSEGNKGDNAQAEDTRNKSNEEIWTRSIVSFPLFLQHVLRIWLYENKKPDLERLLDKQLLAIFNKCFFVGDQGEITKANNACSFIDLLWRLRVILDEYVIKWVDQGEEEVHQVCRTLISTSKNKQTYINRSRDDAAHQGLSLLQSMLYHSQEITTHYWLTPFLNFMHQNVAHEKDDDANIAIFYDNLCHLDNHLLGVPSGGLSLVERTHLFIKNPWYEAAEWAYESDLESEKTLGVKFSHYWFYKLDFVLWYERRNKYNLWNNFRFTAKNSVEHVSPQNPKDEDTDKVSEEFIDTFGNLALVSRSINSEYSNLPFNEKRQRFINKLKHEDRPDSLKMDLIYQHERWGDDLVGSHHKDMLDILKEYYQKSFNSRLVKLLNKNGLVENE